MCLCLCACAYAKVYACACAHVCGRARACVRTHVHPHALKPPYFCFQKRTQPHTLHASGCVSARVCVRVFMCAFAFAVRAPAPAPGCTCGCAGRHARTRTSTQMRTGLGAARAEEAHMDEILDAHVSRWNTLGSVPPRLPLGLIEHVVAAQSVAHVKVYVPTLKRSTARRCVGHTRVQRPGAAWTAVRRGRPTAARQTNGGVHIHAAAANAARDWKAHPERPSASPLQATTSAMHAWRAARERRRRTSRLQHLTCRERNATCGVASSCAQHTRCCALLHAVLQRATRRVATCNTACCDLQRAVLQPATRQPANSTDPGYHLQQSELQPATRCVARRAATCNTPSCNLQHPVLQSATRGAAGRNIQHASSNMRHRPCNLQHAVLHAVS